MLETQDLKDFSIASWYDTFSATALKTIIIRIPSAVLLRLKSGDNDAEEIAAACDEAFIDALKAAIRALNGEAFVKTNWHAPIDAKFVSLGYSLTVTSMQDIFLYLTSSEITSADFDHHKFDDFCLALKPWTNIHPASEFRCIVVHNVLRGITPRDWPTFYAHFNEDGPNIIQKLSEFYKVHIHQKFPRKTYTFDVILTFPDNISLLDFGVLNNKSQLYAFTWKEIQGIIQKNSEEEVAPVFRYLESDLGIMTRTEGLLKFQQSGEA